jgi:hypothetical protein
MPLNKLVHNAVGIGCSDACFLHVFKSKNICSLITGSINIGILTTIIRNYCKITFNYNFKTSFSVRCV